MSTPGYPAVDDHRFIITAPWGDSAYADTWDGARSAARQLAQDARDAGTAPGARTEDVNIIDRGYAPPEED